MIYKPFKDIKLSALGMGNMRLPVKTIKGVKSIDEQKAQRIIDHAMKSGINYYDTAYMYHSGQSEIFLGDALKKYDRKSYYLATKYNINSGDDYKFLFEDQLKKLKTDYIDFYLIHSLSDGTYKKYIQNGSVDYLLKQKEQGRIGYLGFSSHASPKVLKEFADHIEWDFAQIQLNYFDWLFFSAKKEYEALRQRNIPIMVMEPVRGGRLAELCTASEKMLKTENPDYSMAKWAFMWLKRLEGIQVILSGMTTMEQLKENIDTFSNTDALTDKQKDLLFRAAAVFKNSVTIPCTACRYCVSDCPSEIAIPEYIEAYNIFKTQGRFLAMQFLKSFESKGKPSECISCDVCNSLCPQDIDVKTVMAALSNAKIE